MRCRRWSRRPGLFYVLQIFLWTASFRVNTEIVAWRTVRRILWRFLTCVCHAFFSMWRSCPGYVLKVYYGWRTCLWLAFRKQFAGKAYLKINLLVKTLLHSCLWVNVTSSYSFWSRPPMEINSFLHKNSANKGFCFDFHWNVTCFKSRGCRPKIIYNWHLLSNKRPLSNSRPPPPP